MLTDGIKSKNNTRHVISNRVNFILNNLIHLIYYQFYQKEGLHKRHSLYKVIARIGKKTKNTIHNTKTTCIIIIVM